jgi:glycosyltransferase involved in cell wall biosynthesis
MRKLRRRASSGRIAGEEPRLGSRVSQQAPRFSVLVNNYNYGEFLGTAIGGALGGGSLVGEVIVVDDGSTDDSLEVIRDWERRDPRVRCVAKPNGGQLSALNAGIEASRRTEDIVCFLDADDAPRPGYFDRLAAVFAGQPAVDFVFCRSVIVGDRAGAAPWDPPHGDHDYGQTFLRTLVGNEWIGAPTSAIAMRRALAEDLLPCPLETVWRTSADNVLVLGASLVGARKYHMAWPGIDYRVHGGNFWFGRERTPRVRTEYQRAYNRTITHYLSRVEGAFRIRSETEGLPRLLAREFRTIPAPLASEARAYAKLVRRHRGPRRLRSWWRIWSHYRSDGVR